MKYRAEIDGLRALAILPVMFFHAGFEVFSGGYIGVDVFFVISGYLITTILIEDIENNRFSIVHFYERRARRILPALFFVMLACVPFAWLWMFPHQLKLFTQGLVAVSFFASNILFWQDSGYFAAAADENPLLHTWSLAVEEQYYLLFPVFLYIAWRLGKKRVFWLIVVIAVISLALSEWGWRNAAAANFFLAPTRAWELFAGSIAAFIVQKRGVRPSNTLSFFGLAAVLFAIFAYDKSTPFPSLYALVPVAGVVLLVLFAGKDTVAAKLLSMKLFVGIGLVSYSAYLWHQPLFAFSRIAAIDSDFLMLILSLASFLLAYVSWRFVERPFRDRTAMSRRTIFIFSAIGILIFTLLGLLGQTGIIDGKMPEMQLSYSSSEYERQCELTGSAFKKETCFIIGQQSVTPTTLIVGDSHAAATMPELARLFQRRGESAIIFKMAGCTPIRNVAISVPNVFDDCLRITDYVYDNLLSEQSFDNVILISRWSAHWLDFSPFDNGEGGREVFQRGLSGSKLVGIVDGQKTTDRKAIANLYFESFKLLNEQSNMILVYPIPEVGWNVPRKIHSRNLFGVNLSEHDFSTSYAVFKDRNKSIYDLFDSFDLPLNLVKPEFLFCNTTVPGRCITHINGNPLYFDDDHLSDYGARFVIDEIEKQLR